MSACFLLKHIAWGCREAILNAFPIYFRGTGKYFKVIGLSEYLNEISAYFIFKAYAVLLRSTVSSIHPAILDAFSIFHKGQ